MSVDYDGSGWSPPVPPRADALRRPAQLEDVRGQDEAIAALRAFIQEVLAPDGCQPSQRTLLLSGVAGIGKTTLVRIAASIFLCEDLHGALRPCGRCATCLALQKTPPERVDDLIEISAAEHSGVDAMCFLVDQMRRAPLGRYRVGFADEAHRTSRAGKDALLKSLEEPPSWAIYILATTEPEKLGPAMLSRCTHIALRAPQTADRLGLLRRRCEAWGLAPCEYDEAALELIAARSGPSYRELVAEFDRRVVAAPLTLNEVRRAYPDPFVPCLSCLECLLDGDLNGAVAVLSEMQGAPGEKRDMMQEFLFNLSLYDVRRFPAGRHPLSDLPIERRLALVARLDARPARALSPSLASFLEDCARLWGQAP